MIILTLIKEYRADMPLLGTRKLYHLLAPELEKHGIKMGRDQLFNLLRFHGLLIRNRRRMARTTNSSHWLKKYPNLTVSLRIDAANQLWISDITYVRTLNGFSYLSLVTDAYSRKIIGYCLYETLEAQGCLLALSMAIDSRGKIPKGYKTIHHSDRGVQYCSAEYVDMLVEANIAISMTQSGSPYENAIAERVNGIIKNEFDPNVIYKNHNQAKRSISKAIEIYNGRRPHLSLDYKTPEEAYSMAGPIAKRWKNYQRANNGNSTQSRQPLLT